MNVKVKEAVFESAIEGALLTGGPDSVDGDFLALEDPAAYGSWTPGGYRHRLDADYDKATLLLGNETPRVWHRLVHLEATVSRATS